MTAQAPPTEVSEIEVTNPQMAALRVFAHGFALWRGLFSHQIVAEYQQFILGAFKSGDPNWVNKQHGTISTRILGAIASPAIDETFRLMLDGDYKL